MAQEQTVRAAEPADGTAHRQPPARGRNQERRQSVRRHVIRLVLIPSIVAMTLWIVASGYLVFQGYYNREVANSVRDVSIPAVPALTSIFQERRLSVSHLARSGGDLQRLVEQRKQTDERIAALRTAATGALKLAPDSIVTRWERVSDQLDQLSQLRSTVDSRTATEKDVYTFYNGLLDNATDLFNTQARIVPDVTASQGGITATNAFRASDLMSRAASKMESAFGSGRLGEADYLEFVGLVGAYRAALDDLAPYLRPEARAGYDKLTTGDAWRELGAAEDAITKGSVWPGGGVPRGLSGVSGHWEALTVEVSNGLIAMTITQADVVSYRALQTGNRQLLLATLGSVLALSITIAAILIALRQSKELPARLAKLGDDAAALVDQQLPTMMEQLRRREQVDMTLELPLQDYGRDEIGEMAAVINRSLQAAAGAAIDEAKTRVAGTAMLMGVARRPQRPVQRGLQVIETLQDKIGDEEVLHSLFDINHQLTQTRRFLENLVILAGGQIGRRFRNPVPVRRVLLAAFAESQQYQRITLRRAPDAAIVGQSVAGTIHLFAELLDNALTFSRPDTTVWVSCYEVSRGVAVEIEDAGVGIQPEALSRINELLATVPVPDVTALKDGAQVGMHVVAELAKRDGIKVTLRPSAYGGLMAVVLLPDRMITSVSADAPPPAVDPPAVDPPGVDPSAVGPLAVDPSAVDPSGVEPTVFESPTAEFPTVEHSAPAVPPAPAAPPAPRHAVPPVPEPLGWRDERLIAQPAAVGRPAWDEEPVVAPAWVPAAANAGARSASAPFPDRPPLPQRAPQQHLVEELRDDPFEAAGPRNAVRTPEESRDRFSAYQQALAAGKAAGRSAAGTAAGRSAPGEAAGRHETATTDQGRQP